MIRTSIVISHDRELLDALAARHHAISPLQIWKRFRIKETEMSVASIRANSADPARRIDRRPYDSPVGLKMVVPGWPQCSWGQRQRGLVLVGSFVVALAVGLWTWGTLWGWAFLAFAFITQVTSATDVLRQGSFPIHPPRTAIFFVASVLALLFYFPTIFILSEVARPGFEPHGTGSGFLVNCWAYHGDSKPHEGQWIWMKLPPLGEQRAARVIAVAGQEVEWTGQQWSVDGHECRVHLTYRRGARPQVCHFKVPLDEVLVEPDDDGESTPSFGPVVLVPPDAIIGRAWAHFYPVWDRHLL
jgi:Signal peptidase, peptidase S26